MRRIIIQRQGTLQRVIDVDTMQEVDGYKSLDLKPKLGSRFRARLVFEPEVVDVQILDAPQLELFPDWEQGQGEEGEEAELAAEPSQPAKKRREPMQPKRRPKHVASGPEAARLLTNGSQA